MIEDKKIMIKELTNETYSLLAEIYNEQKSGLKTEEEAQKEAILRIKDLRYGDQNKDYFWINDMHPKMIMHPYRPDLNGQDLTNYRDYKNKKLFVEFVKVVKEQDNGFVNYMWQWEDVPDRIVPKLSYVKGFKPGPRARTRADGRTRPPLPPLARCESPPSGDRRGAT